MINKKVIDEKNLNQNIKYIKTLTPKICFMVKADAYGHSINNIIKNLNEKVDFFGVANSKEAFKLKRVIKNTKHNNTKILIVGKEKNFKSLINNQISLVVENYLDIKKVDKVAGSISKTANIHIKINTGMNRLGVNCLDEYKKMLQKCLASKHINLEGVCTHFLCAEDEGVFNNQIQLFEEYINVIPSKLKPIIHIGGSFVLGGKLPNFIDMVRVGFWAYGYGNNNVKPVMKIYSKIISIQKIKQGDYVGYDKKFIAKKDMKIAIIKIGYADGLVRNLSNKYMVKILLKNASNKISKNQKFNKNILKINKKQVKIGKFLKINDLIIKKSNVLLLNNNLKNNNIFCNKYEINQKIENKKYNCMCYKRTKIIGNICMDMCMIDITKINAKVGDLVVVFDNANYVSKIANISPYEVLTNFRKLR